MVSVVTITTLVPATTVVITAASLGSVSYCDLLTPGRGNTSGLVTAAVQPVIIVLLLTAVPATALALNIYCFSHKISHLAVYKRIL